ncbi:hypothetical protein [Natrinema caseinilyticum]|uniref:hypothetical protein n=1 Tax=Natrinema caseinilyticum TaxID=2961570 RepID=UPI0020C5370A|nr:hypothetical protein [Natrinema caseinilyticum]
MLALSLGASTVLVGVGLVQLSITGDRGSVLRTLGIGLFLVLFTVGYYRTWR